MKTPHEFYLAQNGKTVDVDGYYGPQCWDLFAHFCRQAGYPIFNCTTSGYVKDIWNNRKTSGILNYFVEVSVNAMQDGDWVIWGNCRACPDSHIAMFRKDNRNGTGIFLGQNQIGSRAANQVNLPYDGIIGVLRPKCYVTSGCPYFKKSGTVEALFNSIRVRTEPSLSRGNTGLVYNAGMVLNYYDIVNADGWYWAKYKRTNGGTGYCALCTTDGKNKYWKQR